MRSKISYVRFHHTSGGTVYKVDTQTYSDDRISVFGQMAAKEKLCLLSLLWEKVAEL